MPCDRTMCDVPGIRNSISPFPSSRWRRFRRADPGVAAARHLERDSGGQVSFDQARDHVDRRFLGRDDQVHADGSCLLCQPDDVLLDFLPAVMIRSAISSAMITMRGM